MAKKPNYGFEKRKKELDRKAKQDAKRQRKRDEAGKPADDVPPPVPNEPFSWPRR